MANHSPSQARNYIRKSLRAILDPPPKALKDIDALWQHFGSACAYCGVAIERNSRSGQLDHSDSSALGGSNSIFNRVLACGKCNGDLKREMPWDEFLKSQATETTIYAERLAKIESWRSRAEAREPTIDAAKVESIINQAIAAYDAAVAELRSLRPTE